MGFSPKACDISKKEYKNGVTIICKYEMVTGFIGVAQSQIQQFLRTLTRIPRTRTRIIDGNSTSVTGVTKSQTKCPRLLPCYDVRQFLISGYCQRFT